eukprot:scaffold3620_cov417-Prasinococcus_capsulatus_cf.AAC.4
MKRDSKLKQEKAQPWPEYGSQARSQTHMSGALPAASEGATQATYQSGPKRTTQSKPVKAQPKSQQPRGSKAHQATKGDVSSHPRPAGTKGSGRSASKSKGAGSSPSTGTGHKRPAPDSAGADSTQAGGTYPRKAKKPRLVWTTELHSRFMNAVNHLGITKAVPKTILQLMNVDGMTRENVASHLQKYRLYMKKLAGLPPNASLSEVPQGSAGHSLMRGAAPTLQDLHGSQSQGMYHYQPISSHQGRHIPPQGLESFPKLSLPSPSHTMH